MITLPDDPDAGQPQSVADSIKQTKCKCGGGCAVSTAADYMRFAQAMLNKGKPGDTRIPGRKTVEYMTSDHLGPEVQNYIARADPNRAGYGFGLGLAARKAPVFPVLWARAASHLGRGQRH